MKNTLKAIFTVALFFTFLFVTGFGRKKKENIAVKVQALNMNVLYYGVDNPISVTASGIDLKNLSVSCAGGKIVSVNYKNMPGCYLIQPDTFGSLVKIRVRDISAADSSLIQSEIFRVKKMPPPSIAFYAGPKYVWNEAELTIEEMGQISSLQCRLQDFDFECRMSITSFVMSVNENGKWMDYKANGPVLTTEMRNALQKVKVGDRVLFHDVSETASDGIPRKITGVIVSVY